MTDREELFEALIGHKNTDYYMVYFQRAEARGYPPVSWNWPGFLAGLIWLLYRRQYSWGAMYFGITLAIIFVTSLLHGIVEPATATLVLYTCMLLFQNVYFPLNANGIYYRWARKEVDNAMQLFPGQKDKQLEHLSGRGGANANIIFMVVSLLFIISSFFTSLQPPQG